LLISHLLHQFCGLSASCSIRAFVSSCFGAELHLQEVLTGLLFPNETFLDEITTIKSFRDALGALQFPLCILPLPFHLRSWRPTIIHLASLNQACFVFAAEDESPAFRVCV
jgi:hypothetical protein